MEMGERETGSPEMGSSVSCSSIFPFCFTVNVPKRTAILLDLLIMGIIGDHYVSSKSRTVLTNYIVFKPRELVKATTIPPPPLPLPLITTLPIGLLEICNLVPFGEANYKLCKHLQ